MDTTETYQKMCEKAVETQEGHPKEGVSGRWLAGSNVILCDFTSKIGEGKCGDYYAVFDVHEARICPTCGNQEDYIKSSKSIWLPRQDQLQEMVGKPTGRLIDDFDNWFQKLSEFTPAIPWDKIYFGSSMEQLWLAFVMHEKYGKVWNSTDWIKEGTD